MVSSCEAIESGPSGGEDRKLIASESRARRHTLPLHPSTDSTTMENDSEVSGLELSTSEYEHFRRFYRELTSQDENSNDTVRFFTRKSSGAVSSSFLRFRPFAPFAPFPRSGFRASCNVPAPESVRIRAAGAPEPVPQ